MKSCRKNDLIPAVSFPKKPLALSFPGKRPMSALILLFFPLLLPILFALSGCGPKPEPVTKHGFYFDTVIQITLYDKKYEPLIDDCFALAEEFEQKVSKTRPESEIYELNHANGASVSLSPDTLSLLQTGLSYCEISGGSFDPTIGALAELWDIKNNPGKIPTKDQIGAALSTVGYKNILLSDQTASLANPNTQVDLGGLAKGYMADRMKEYLNEQGVCEGFINLGGNVLVLGPKQDGQPYTIGIQKPFADPGVSLLSVEVSDGTVVSSGVYERFFEKDGKIYHHILDPATGYPFDNGLLSVTVLCPSSADGDALSTTCFSLGKEEGLALIESLPDTEAIFITEDFELVFSSGMGSRIPYSVLE